jgi:hypothetical protein
MIGDHFTKYLQGALFNKFRAEVQGIPTDLSNVELGWDREEKNEGIERGSTDPSPQECVGKDTTSVPAAAGLIRRYGKSDLIPLYKILDPPLQHQQACVHVMLGRKCRSEGGVMRTS